MDASVLVVVSGLRSLGETIARPLAIAAAKNALELFESGVHEGAEIGQISRAEAPVPDHEIDRLAEDCEAILRAPIDDAEAPTWTHDGIGDVLLPGAELSPDQWDPRSLRSTGSAAKAWRAAVRRAVSSTPLWLIEAHVRLPEEFAEAVLYARGITVKKPRARRAAP